MDPIYNDPSEIFDRFNSSVHNDFAETLEWSLNEYLDSVGSLGFDEKLAKTKYKLDRRLD